MSSSSSPTSARNHVPHETQMPETEQTTIQPNRYRVSPQQTKHASSPGVNTTPSSSEETHPPQIPPKHPGRKNSDGPKHKSRGSERISPLASPARAHVPSPGSSSSQYSNIDANSTSTVATEDVGPLPAPPPSPKPFLSKSARHIFGVNLTRRPPLGLNIQSEYLDQTTTSFSFLELQDTINRTYGTEFDADEISSLILRAKERGNLVEISPFVYRFDLEDHQDKMARFIKERAKRKKEGMEKGRVVRF